MGNDAGVDAKRRHTVAWLVIGQGGTTPNGRDDAGRGYDQAHSVTPSIQDVEDGRRWHGAYPGSVTVISTGSDGEAQPMKMA
jgi:hypothetical protein